MVAGVRYKCATNKLLEATEGLNLTFIKAVEVAEATIVNEEKSQMYVKAADNKSEMHTVSVKGEYSRSFNPSVRAKSFGPKPNSEKPRSDFSLPRSKVNPNLTRPKSDLHMQNRGKCFWCLSENHFANVCKFKQFTCRKCRRVGHIAVACQNGKNLVEMTEGLTLFDEPNLDFQDPKDLPYRDIDVCNVDSRQKCENSVGLYPCSNSKPTGTCNNRGFQVERNCGTDEYDIFNINLKDLHNLEADLTAHSDKYFSDMEVNGKCVKFEIDTGAAVTCIGEEVFKQFVVMMN